tara:strand:- start:122 stop:256 length:135 start_codon:yes stop_codon:yes gene_type:complete
MKWRLGEKLAAPAVAVAVFRLCQPPPLPSGMTLGVQEAMQHLPQ